MPRLIRNTLVSVRDLIAAAGPFALLAGEIDGLVLTAAPESLMVRMLLQTPGVKLFEFAQTDVYAHRLPFLGAVVLPRGVGASRWQ